MLSPNSASAMEGAISMYEEIVSGGGWEDLPARTLKKGAKGEAVIALRQRLIQNRAPDPIVGVGIEGCWRGFIKPPCCLQQPQHAHLFQLDQRIAQTKRSLQTVRDMTYQPPMLGYQIALLLRPAFHRGNLRIVAP